MAGAGLRGPGVGREGGREGGEDIGARVKESRSLGVSAGPRPGLRTRAGVRASLAQANIFPPGGGADVGDRRRGLLSRFLSAE